MARIMIDLDGPVVDFGTGMMPCLEEQGITTDAGDYYFGAPKEGFRERMRTAIRNQGVFARCLPHPDAVDGLWKLHLAGNELYAVSARIYGHDTAAWSYFQTMKWMQKYGAPPMEIILVEHGTNKAPICREFGLSLAIEDDLRNFDDLALSPDTTVYLMDRHWNQSVIADPYRVFNWAEFVERIKKEHAR